MYFENHTEVFLFIPWCIENKSIQINDHNELGIFP